MNKGPVPPLPSLEISEELRAAARTACAYRALDRGEEDLAASYERGEQDQGWAFRHEVNRLIAEAGK